MLETIVPPFFNAFLLFAAVILLTRINGLRSFAKMSSFDFAMTVAIGSTLASGITGSSESLTKGLVALAALFAAQAVVAVCRPRSRHVKTIVDNTPLLLMRNGEVIEEHLVEGRIAREDLAAVLRGAGVRRLSDVHAVVLETTGDVSVLAGGDGVDGALLSNVRGAESPGGRPFSSRGGGRAA